MNRFSTTRVVRSAAKFFISILGAGLALLAQSGVAGEAEEVAAIRTLLQATQPDMEIQEITASPVSGLYQVNIQRGQTLFVSSDARYLIPGDLYETSPMGLVNLGEQRRNELRKELMAALDEEDMIIFPAEGEAKATLSVFTDVDCPYCRKLHDEIDQLNASGVTVRYLAYPRTGLETKEHYKMASTWCADDRRAMFTFAKRGGDVPQAECDDPVEEHFAAGKEAGVTGTPALVFEDGSIVPGYIPAATLTGYLFNKE